MLKNRKTTILWITLPLILALIGCTTKTNFEAPLAPTLGISTATLPASLGEPEATQPPAVNPALPAETTAPVEATPTAANTLCGQTGSMTLLMVGTDVLGSSKPHGADAIRIVKADFDNKMVKVITFPRDLLVQTASVNDGSMIQQKLGLTFYDGFTAASGTPIEKNAVGARVLAQLLLNNFGVHSDHYMTLQMDQLSKMIDTIGGVEINIPAAITTDRNISFPAGVQILSGAMATEYVRFLNPGGEEARTARQNEFIKALLAKMISLDILPQLPALLLQFQDAVITDLSSEQLISLACLSVQSPKKTSPLEPSLPPTS